MGEAPPLPLVPAPAERVPCRARLWAQAPRTAKGPNVSFPWCGRSAPTAPALEGDVVAASWLLAQDVGYPEFLNIRPYMSQSSGEPVTYGLYAVLVHSGHSCHAGHYYCYVKVRGSRRVGGGALRCAPVQLWPLPSPDSVGSGGDML